VAKTEFLQIRVTPQDRERIERAAAAAHLEPSTWARQAILRAVDTAEAEAPPHERAAGSRR
jgi:hypothetical protein